MGEEETKREIPTNFKYGDLIIKCHQCGNEEIVEELVTDGRAVYLFNHDESFLKLHCTKCDITMEMSLKPSANPPLDEEDVTDAEILDESTDENYVEDEKLQEEITEEKNI